MIKKKKKTKALLAKRSVKRTGKSTKVVGTSPVSSKSTGNTPKKKSGSNSIAASSKPLTKKQSRAKSNKNLKPPWKKGCPSPNPGGRVKGSSTTALRHQDMKRLCKGIPYAVKYCRLVKLDPKKTTIGELIAAVANFKALEDAPYYRENLNRDEGKTPDKIITADAGPLSEMDEDTLNRIIGAGGGSDNGDEDE